MRARQPISGIAGALLLGVLLSGCDPIAVEVPASQSLGASALLARQGIDTRIEPRGPRHALRVRTEDAPSARALLAAAGYPRTPATAPARLLTSPTEARILADQAARARLVEALRALPDVLDAQVADTPDGLAVALTVLPAGQVAGADAARLAGPSARVALTVFEPPPPPARRARPSMVLSAIIALLMGTVIALLVRVRRLRIALGR